jgi:hypothetical protein
MAAVPSPVPVTTPAHLFGLEAIHFLIGGNRRTGILIRRPQPPVFRKRMRRKRSGLRTRSQRDGAGGKSKGEFQKVAAFHDISLFVHVE